jgi:hypothetical protein
MIKNGYHGYHAYQVIEKSMRLGRDDGYHGSGASGARRSRAAIRIQTEFGLHLDSSDAYYQEEFVVSL